MNEQSSDKSAETSMPQHLVPLAMEQQAKVLTMAVERMLQNVSNADFGSSCDDFTYAARSLASLAYSQRIRRLLDGFIDNDRCLFKPSSLSEKRAVSQEIRRWLLTWNLGLRDATSGHVYQLYAFGSENDPQGRFTASMYGSRDNHRIQSAKEVCALLSRCDLVDVQRTKEVGGPQR